MSVGVQLRLTSQLHPRMYLTRVLVDGYTNISRRRGIHVIPHSAQQSILLTDADLPMCHPDFLKLITKVRFREKFGDSPVT